MGVKRGAEISVSVGVLLCKLRVLTHADEFIAGPRSRLGAHLLLVS